MFARCVLYTSIFVCSGVIYVVYVLRDVSMIHLHLTILEAYTSVSDDARGTYTSLYVAECTCNTTIFDFFLKTCNLFYDSQDVAMVHRFQVSLDNACF